MEEAGQDGSNINPVALVFLVLMSLVTLCGRRQAAVRALLAIAAFLPLGQQVVLAGIHFQFFRILILIGFCRLMVRGEMGGFRWNAVDKLFVGWVLAGLFCGILRDPGAIMGMTCLGGAFNSFGTYFLIRCLTRDPSELIEHLRVLAVVAVVIAIAMLCETITHRNPFFAFGGVPEVVIEREGRFRCQGPFRHPILAGTFAATLLPLLVGLWLQGGKDKKLALVGMIGCTFSSLVAASSGAILTCLTAMVGFGLWPLRRQMYLIRRGIFVTIVGLALLMEAPVWYLIAKLSDLLGGAGWHRSYLIDQALKHFAEWFLIGSSYTAHWAPSGQVLAVDPNNMDITNHYIQQGLHGGLLRLGLFIGTITACFKIIGWSVRNDDVPPLKPRLLWAFGVCLACHCTAFISISYFDQIEVFWFWLLAGIATIPTYRELAHTSQGVVEEEGKSAPAHDEAVPTFN